MISFVIPSGFGGLSSPKTIYPDNNPTIQNVKKESKMRFGEGYKSVATLSKTKKSISLTFTNRDPVEIKLIKDYFVHLGGAPVNAFVVLEDFINVRVVRFSRSYQNGEVNGLRAQFEEV